MTSAVCSCTPADSNKVPVHLNLSLYPTLTS